MKLSQFKNFVDIFSIKLDKEGSLHYKGWTLHRPGDSYMLMGKFLNDLDWQHFLVISFDTKNQQRLPYHKRTLSIRKRC